MSCAVCRRDTRGFGFNDPWGGRWKACSITCVDILYLWRGKLPDLTRYEADGIECASDAAGAYLEGIGKSDLATMTGDEWRELLTIAFTSTCAEVQRRADLDAVAIR